MQAHALICDAQQNFSLETVTLPDPAPDQIAIRTHFSGVSIGTEFALIRNKISWGPFPICTGYQGTGVVEAIGSAIDNFAVGDAVYFRRNNGPMNLIDGTPVSTTQGTHCSHIVVQPNTTHGAYPMIPGADMAVTSLFVLPAVGLYGVDMANPQMGDVVVVYGAGAIGQGVIAACAARGCEVVAVDVDDMPLEIARQMGADHIINGLNADVPETVRKLAPDGADVVFECTGIPAQLDPAIKLTRPHGKFVWQGNYGADPVSLHFLPPHVRRLQMFFPCDDGLQPCRRAVIKNMVRGVLPWEHTITHRIAFGDAPDLYARINSGAESDVMGVVIDWRTG